MAVLCPRPGEFVRLLWSRPGGPFGLRPDRLAGHRRLKGRGEPHHVAVYGEFFRQNSEFVSILANSVELPFIGAVISETALFMRPAATGSRTPLKRDSSDVSMEQSNRSRRG